MYEYLAKIVSVYDGDTFTFEVDLGFSIKVKEKLRLYGCDTPEVRGPEKEQGKAVRDYVRELILNETVKIKVHKKGKYGRYVAEVLYKPFGRTRYVDLTEKLIEMKFARRVKY